MSAEQTLVEVAALDHVHLYAADTRATAAWYGRVLGLKILPSSKRLHDAYYLATSRGIYCATLFPGVPPSDGDHTSAFRVSGAQFMQFGDGLPHDDVLGRNGTPLQSTDAADHQLAWSFYFQDPDGNHLEITTYDHEPVRAWFKGKGVRHG